MVLTLESLTSAARRRTRPGMTFPPARRHLGSSAGRTFAGLSPLLRRLTSWEPWALPQPTLKAQLTRAPYWFSLSLTLSLVYLAMQFWKPCAVRR